MRCVPAGLASTEALWALLPKWAALHARRWGPWRWTTKEVAALRCCWWCLHMAVSTLLGWEWHLCKRVLHTLVDLHLHLLVLLLGPKWHGCGGAKWRLRTVAKRVWSC